MIPAIVDDRLYGLSIRPQELALYGEQVAVSLRYSPIFDDQAETCERHFKLLVLEITAELPADDALLHAANGPLQLVKCGWELELSSPQPCLVGSLEELPEEVPRFLERIAETINDLARRARIDPPLGPELVTTLMYDYRLRRI
jgi:hypothetical protein